METADVVIVGGGVVGTSLAYHLAERGLDVALLERDSLGAGSTSRNAGGVRQQFSNELNVRLGMLSVRMLERFEEEVGVPADFHQYGYLFLLTRPGDVKQFRDNLDLWARCGLTEAGWVEPEEAARLVPGLEIADVLGGTFCPTDGIASPDAVCMGYAGAARRRGARLHEGRPATGIRVAAGGVAAVETDSGPIATEVVFNCAGPWAGELGRLAGVDVPVAPYRRHIWVTGAVPGLPASYPMTVDFATTFYFHPEAGGLLFGMADRDEGPTFNTEVDGAFATRAFEAAVHRLPVLAEAGVRSAWAGLYESTPDHQAILGPVAAVRGFWCACGFSGHGFMQAPAVGRMLTQQLVDGRSDLDLAPFRHDRFAAGALATERNVI